MRAKERVITTFAHEQADRVPLDYSANPGIDARLKQHFGLAADDNEGLLQALDIDFRAVGPGYTGPRLHAEAPDRHVDPLWGNRMRWIEHSSGGYWDYCEFPLKDASPEVIANWPIPSPDDFDYRNIAAECRHNEEYCVFTGNPGLADIINSSGMLCGMEQVLIGLATDDEALLTYIDRRVDCMVEVTNRTIEASAGGINLLWMGEDLGSQHAPLISLPMYRKYLRPRHQRFIDIAHQWSIPVMIHTCGSSSWAYEDFIEMGVNAVDTLQPEATNMSPAYLKSHFGSRLAFHGCISTAGPLAYGTVDEVVADVRQTLDIMTPGCGYALAPTHMIQDNTPTENVIAMYETAKNYCLNPD